MESEFLAQIPADDRVFLTRSAALERMSAAICEATLDLAGAAATLAVLAESNMLLVPLDRRGQWYRYHHLFGEMLRAELERREPGMMSAIRRRAASWCLANDMPEDAIDYSIAAEDTETAARLVEQIGLRMYWHGQRETLDRWIRWLDQRDAISAHPIIAVIASFLCSSTVRPSEALRWADLLDQWQFVDPDWRGDRTTEAFTALLRAQLCRHGDEQMRRDLDEAAEKFAAVRVETPNLDIYHGLACILAGESDDADGFFQDAVRVAEKSDLQEVLACALFERSMLAMARGDWTEARGFADQLRTVVKRPGAEEAFVWVAQARVAAHERDFTSARDALARAQPLRPLIATPHLAVQLRIELARAYLGLADFTGARTMMREAQEILERRPNLGTFVTEVGDISSKLSEHLGRSTVGPSALTTAELRLLPMLCTHLTVKEIAAELYVSRNTINSQMQSIYRKLDANKRSEAVTRARELHLVE
jgi:LuxR family maltose regulon positive regulatory protein